MDKNMERQMMPAQYRWVLEKGLAGVKPFTALQPWYFLQGADVFSVNAKWPSGPSKTELLAFARRQDDDDIACFEMIATETHSVVVIQGWTACGEGYEVVRRYPSFWDWLKSVVDDIAESCRLTEESKRQGDSGGGMPPEN